MLLFAKYCLLNYWGLGIVLRSIWVWVHELIPIDSPDTIYCTVLITPYGVHERHGTVLSGNARRRRALEPIDWVNDAQTSFTNCRALRRTRESWAFRCVQSAGGLLQFAIGVEGPIVPPDAFCESTKDVIPSHLLPFRLQSRAEFRIFRTNRCPIGDLNYQRIFWPTRI